MVNVFSKIWHKDKKLFVVLISALILIPIGTTIGYFEESSHSKSRNSVIPFMIFVGIIGVLSMKKKRGRVKGGVRRGWSEIEKEEVRERQGGMCNKCGRPPPRWEYHHRDGNRSNNSLSNCEGLCPNCHSVKTHD